jgi:PLP dependent protein
MTPDETRRRLAERLQSVRERIAAAGRRAGRDPAGVTLVAVTKSVGPEVAALLPELGVSDLGESRPQELWRKAAALPAGVRWHLVGHLQRNKIDKTRPLVALVHSVDSVRLLRALADDSRPVDVLLEVNAGREPQKGGFAPEEVPALRGEVGAARPGVRVCGLMTMAALEGDPERCRPTFRGLRHLRDRLRAEWGAPLDWLSMGMTNDFEVAVEEGATHVRVGSALFEGLGR